MSAREGGRILVEQLLVHGGDCAFTVPGESFLPVLDAFHDVQDRLKLVVCRHEAGAANMAEAYGKLTNRPGLCFVTRGPGATHASIGVHTAFQDSTPMILFIGDVGSDFRGREAFQEVDFAAMFAPLAKWAARIDDVERIPEFVARAFHVATSGRRGPVVLALPEDMLSKKATVADARQMRIARAAGASRIVVGAEIVAEQDLAYIAAAMADDPPLHARHAAPGPREHGALPQPPRRRAQPARDPGRPRLDARVV